LSHSLIRTSKTMWAGPFIPGDVYWDSGMLPVVPIAWGFNLGSLPDLSTLTSLNLLQGHASCFLYLFTDEQ
ncbi:hypothetical protein EDC04DRAFT_2521903, partial [Pisolithus marmoratus]